MINIIILCITVIIVIIFIICTFICCIRKKNYVVPIQNNIYSIEDLRQDF
mgnify:CR=1 FL=1